MTFDQPLPPPLGRSVSIFLIATWAVLCLAFLPLYVTTFHSFDIDFDAFYCGAHALTDGHNPYLQEPLHTCEAPIFFHDIHTDAVIPAPLPGYALAAFEPLARLRPTYAGALWSAMLCAVLAWTIILMQRISRVGWAQTAIVVLIADGLISLSLGQIVPLCVLGLLVIADALQRGRPWPTAVGMLLICAQPQAALPVAVSLLLFGSMRVRLATLIGGIIAVLLSVLVVGIGASTSYAFTGLPLQELAELVNVNQLSLSSLLYQAGASSQVSLAVGTASYVGLSIGGIIAARTFSNRFGDPAFLALLPAACSVCAGSYVHLQMYAMAIPFGLLVLRYLPIRGIAALLIIVAIPWEWDVATMFLFPVLTVTTVLLAHLWLTRSALRGAAIGLAVLIGCITASLSYIHAAPHAMPTFHYTIEPNALVQYAWIYVERTYSTIGGSPGLTIARWVSVVGLLSLLTGSTLATFRAPSLSTGSA